ncbi:LysR family transcriptional regulator [Methylobacterium sp. E-045]|uniref:LysR substrate-binding domain-containing protein n=1 Tax=Methylobacterium sp. E-045 TaxID=2836575 RepID=UPI001FB96B19|nr:LysR family transcriptional regulator [Methylobacterium sp. E-045]MCJ2130673.1 LysR family transcriptional regulator [Methylobacterium sp. E-045]
MPELTLDLRYLRYAFQVAEAGSFRRAADLLSISQSTVSRRVQMLERQLGVSLFVRSRSGASMTLEGERFLQQASIGARYLRDAATEIRSIKRSTTGIVRLGMLEAFPACPIMGLVGTFRSRNPTIEVKLEENTSEENAYGVKRGSLDVAISLSESVDPDLRVRWLCKPDLFVALSPLHSLAARSHLAWGDICNEVFLVRSDGAGRELTVLLRQMFGEFEGSIQLSVHQVSRDTLLTMVEQGFGITVTSAISRPNIALAPIAKVRPPTAAMISSSYNENPALRLLLKCFDTLSGVRLCNCAI